MKREIKFRGYDPDTKRWYYGSLVKQNKTTYVTSEDYDQNPSNTEWFILWDEMTDWCLPNRHIQGSVDPKSIGEYTGLHDKNGREIYEGDIVRTGKDNIGDPELMIGQVIMREGSWLIENEKKQEAIDLFSEITSREVIGNIFDNPELLEGKQ
ncbi:YopX family protein [Lacticaseibacillus paracasei]|uniref:YopX family protein n=1 Tax=Lacticaseibacillus paracasei TaxID=1597 RepID=UPI0021A66905|nr:YopX family protein [Lacticaseibacillus paracasei]MCT3338771.1 hypothetical protein [Lacticaseibacillus paracasei]